MVVMGGEGERTIGTTTLFRLWDAADNNAWAQLWANSAAAAADEWAWIRRTARIVAMVSECDANGDAVRANAARVTGASGRHVRNMLKEFDRRVSVLRADLVTSLHPLTGDPSKADERGGRFFDDAEDVREALRDVGDITEWMRQSERDPGEW